MPIWYTIFYMVSTIFGVKLNYCNEVFICIVQSEVVAITPAMASFFVLRSRENKVLQALYKFIYQASQEVLEVGWSIVYPRLSIV